MFFFIYDLWSFLNIELIGIAFICMLAKWYWSCKAVTAISNRAINERAINRRAANDYMKRLHPMMKYGNFIEVYNNIYKGVHNSMSVFPPVFSFFSAHLWPARGIDKSDEIQQSIHQPQVKGRHPLCARDIRSFTRPGVFVMSLIMMAPGSAVAWSFWWGRSIILLHLTTFSISLIKKPLCHCHWRCIMSLSLTLHYVTVTDPVLCHCHWRCIMSLSLTLYYVTVTDAALCHCHWPCIMSLSLTLHYVTVTDAALCHCHWPALCHCHWRCIMSLSLTLYYVTVTDAALCHCHWPCIMSLSLTLHYVTVTDPA